MSDLRVAEVQGNRVRGMISDLLAIARLEIGSSPSFKRPRAFARAIKSGSALPSRHNLDERDRNRDEVAGLFERTTSP